MITPLWHGVDLTRMFCLGTFDAGMALVHVVYLVGLIVVAHWSRRTTSHEAARLMITLVHSTQVVVLRNFLSFRRGWPVFLTGFLEPVFYLFSIGVGVGELVTGFEVDGHVIPYAAFVAPAMLAASAMNGAIYDSTFNLFFKLKFEKVYDTMLATPLVPRQVAIGELTWCQVRSSLYSAAFLVVMVAMGLAESWWTAWPRCRRRC